MNKLEKFEKFVKTLSLFLESKFGFLCLWVLAILCTLFKELNLVSTFSLVMFLWLSLIFIYLFYFICLVVLACIKKARSKKTNIEKLLDEEIKKG